MRQSYKTFTGINDISHRGQRYYWHKLRQKMFYRIGPILKMQFCSSAKKAKWQNYEKNLKKNDNVLLLDSCIRDGIQVKIPTIIMKLSSLQIFVINYSVCPYKPFQPILMIASKAEAFLSGAPL